PAPGAGCSPGATGVTLRIAAVLVAPAGTVTSNNPSWVPTVAAEPGEMGVATAAGWGASSSATSSLPAPPPPPAPAPPPGPGPPGSPPPGSSSMISAERVAVRLLEMGLDSPGPGPPSSWAMAGRTMKPQMMPRIRAPARRPKRPFTCRPFCGLCLEPIGLVTSACLLECPFAHHQPGSGLGSLEPRHIPGNRSTESPSVALDQDALGRAFQLDGVGLDGELGSEIMDSGFKVGGFRIVDAGLGRRLLVATAELDPGLRPPVEETAIGVVAQQLAARAGNGDVLLGSRFTVTLGQFDDVQHRVHMGHVVVQAGRNRGGLSLAVGIVGVLLLPVLPAEFDGLAVV